jgi:hypothetical protein
MWRNIGLIVGAPTSKEPRTADLDVGDEAGAVKAITNERTMALQMCCEANKTDYGVYRTRSRGAGLGVFALGEARCRCVRSPDSLFSSRPVCSLGAPARRTPSATNAALPSGAAAALSA